MGRQPKNNTSVISEDDIQTLGQSVIAPDGSVVDISEIVEVSKDIETREIRKGNLKNQVMAMSLVEIAKARFIVRPDFKPIVDRVNHSVLQNNVKRIIPMRLSLVYLVKRKYLFAAKIGKHHTKFFVTPSGGEFIREILGDNAFGKNGQRISSETNQSDEIKVEDMKIDEVSSEPSP